MNTSIQAQLTRFEIAYVAPLYRFVRSFWQWWTAELLAILPDSMQQSITASEDNLFVQISGTDLVIFQGNIERMQELVRFPIDVDDKALPEINTPSHQVTLLLPPQAVLDTGVTLPAATEENLREVLAFEMDQLTPFTADEVYYGFEITERSPSKNSISLRLLAAPRTTVDEINSTLQRAGLSPTVITTKVDSSCLGAINLLPKPHVGREKLTERWLNTCLAAIVGLLLIATIAIPLVQKQSLIGELKPRVIAATEAAREGSRLKRKIELIATESAELLQRKEVRPMTIALIDEMSRVLPDDTWLTRMDIAGREIQIQGQSLSAAALIELLEKSPVFENVRFRSPVTQVPRTEAERFHLSANWSSAE